MKLANEIIRQMDKLYSILGSYPIEIRIGPEKFRLLMEELRIGNETKPKGNEILMLNSVPIRAGMGEGFLIKFENA